MLKKFLWKSEPRWVCMLNYCNHLSIDLRQDMVSGYKETYYVWAWSTLPIWIIWCWSFYVILRNHANCRIIRFPGDFTIYVNRDNPSRFSIHNDQGDIVQFLEQSAGTVLLETVVSRYSVSPDTIRLNFTRSSDLVMLKLSTDLLLEQEHVP